MAHNFPGIGSNNPNDVSLYDAHIPADAWTHLAFVYDGTRATIYLNGTVKFDVELTGAKHCGAPMHVHFVASLLTSGSTV
jgi:hypothetical protein